MEETVTMTQKEPDRVKTLHLVLDGRISQITASIRLKLFERQIRRFISKA